VTPLFSFAVLLSAALLFAVQPMFGKMLLPTFGGAPAVWVTSLVFFQLELLAGYLYAHLTTGWLGVRRQVMLHAALLALPIAMLPVHVGAGWGWVSPARPASSVVLLLASSIGLPFFALSATAPLLQRWFASMSGRSARDPYFLYAASNLGSLGALLAYPFLIEPWLPLLRQARVWSAAYDGLVVLMVACAVFVWRFAAPAPAPIESAPAPSWPLRLRWVALAAVPASLMLSVTGYLTMDVAAVPLLWIGPLALYLLTFVLAFSARGAAIGRWFSAALPVLVVPPLLLTITDAHAGLAVIPVHLLTLFGAAMACHGELARTRPAVARLTEFYVWIALGGALGGLFNTLAAPFIFRTLIEYPAGLAIVLLLRPGLQTSAKEWATDLTSASGFAAAIGIAVLLLEFVTRIQRVPTGTVSFLLCVFALPIAILILSWRHPSRIAAGVLAIAAAGAWFPRWDEHLASAGRDFYGTWRIVEHGSYRALQHGTTVHGAQSVRPDRPCLPLAYYYPSGPLGRVFDSLRASQPPHRIGVVGLGAGAIAGYAHPDEAWTFYEIDPAVERIARDPRWFTYLRDCAPQARVVIGDARLSLERQPDGAHDLLILDAFSSDAVPVHLLTREALALYLRKLTPTGVLVFHTSNRYVDLSRVLADLAYDAHLFAYLADDRQVFPVESYDGKLASTWLVIARAPTHLDALRGGRGWAPQPGRNADRRWTDDYTDLLGPVSWALAAERRKSSPRSATPDSPKGP
jgi:hypothetical protein